MADLPRPVPAPWQLRGRGYVALYRFSGAFVRAQGFLSNFHRRVHPWRSDSHTLGGFMLVDYQHSEVGPYQELLFTPGVYRFRGQWVFSISKIYVSTTISVVSGIENWGIPKELADFTCAPQPDGSETWRVGQGGATFFSLTIQPVARWLRFPVTTAPLPFAVVHPLGDEVLVTRPRGRGWGQLVRLRDVRADPRHFPDLSGARPLVAVAVREFRMQFPVPQRMALRDAFSG